MHKMYAEFSDEAYKDMVSGEAKSNNGFRKKNGSFHPDQPKYVEIEDSSIPKESFTIERKTTAIGAIVAFGFAVFPHIKKIWSDVISPRIKKCHDNKIKDEEIILNQVYVSNNMESIIAEELDGVKIIPLKDKKVDALVDNTNIVAFPQHNSYIENR